MANIHIKNSGNDSNNGSTDALAIKTIARLNQIAAAGSGLEPNDQVLIHKSSSFFESAYLPTQNDGTSSSPILTTGYGTGTKPLISGFRPVGNWISSSKGANIYEINNPSFPSDISSLRWNNILRNRGRLPKTSLLHYQTYTSSSITSDQIPNINFSGGEVYAVIEKVKWVHDRVRITGRSGNTLTFTGGSSYNGGEHNFFFIDNAIECLTSHGDWMYSNYEKKLYIFSTVNPNTLGITYISDQYNIHFDGAIYNVVDGLKLEGAWDTAIRGHLSTQLKILNSEFKNHSGVAFRALTATGCHIENNLFEDCLEGGLMITNASNNLNVTKNTFRNIAMQLGYSGNGDGKGAGIFNTSEAMTCSLNRLETIGYVGIRFFGSDVLVEKNFIDGYCLIKHDGGGIYCYGGTANQRTFSNQVLRQNIIKNGGFGQLHDAFAVYIDDNSEDIIIEYNGIINVSNAAIYIHNSHEIIVRHNILWAFGKGIQFGQNGSNELIRNNEVHNNVFVHTSKNSFTYQLSTQGNDLNLFSEFDLNKFVFLQGGRFCVATKHYEGSKLIFNNYSWTQWQSLGFDLNSTIVNLDVPEYTILSEQANRFNFATSVINSANHVGGTAVVTKNPSGYTNTYMVEATTQSATTTRVEFGYGNLGAVDNAKKYIIKFRAMAPSGHQSLIIYIRETQYPYTRASKEIPTYATGQFQDYEFLLTEMESKSQVSVLIECQANQGRLYVSDFEFREVAAEITNLDDHVRVIYNDTESSINVPITGTWVDGNNIEVTGNYQLDSFESAFLRNTYDVDPEPEPTLYNLILESATGGNTLEITSGPYQQGERVELEAIPNDGYQIKWWQIQIGSQSIGYVGTGSYSFSFNMPNDNVRIRPIFELTPTPSPGIPLVYKGRLILG